ncbi:MAG: hypothetical protein H7Y42_09100 [Chitinophagaceae bacterium]|nr:hypothetical protein [Chitinophagaceae bacterium]
MRTEIFFPYLASILFSAITAFVYRKHLGSRNLSIMLPYLILVFIQESILGIASLLEYYTSNAIVYNIYRPVTVMIFAFIYYHIPIMKPLRKVILWITAFYFVVIVVNYLFVESIFTTSSYLVLARGFVITMYGILFLMRYFHLDNREEEKYWHPLIWITTGIVIFYPVISISTSFQKYMTSESLYGFKLYQVIPQVMSIFMYSCFSYAFYLCRRKS